MKTLAKQLSLLNFKKILFTFFCFISLFSTNKVRAFVDISLAETGTIDRIARSIAIIQRSYYAPTRIHPKKMMQEGLDFLANKIPEVLIEFPDDASSREFKITVSGKSKVIKYTNLETLSDILPAAQQTFQFVRENYTGETEVADREYAFIAGMLKTLDPHSNMLTPKVFEEFKTQTTGEYGGIGIVVGIKDDDLTVIAPLEGTPAAKLGIITDDKIQEIDQLPTVNMPLSEAVERLRGKVGSKVTLLLQRKNVEPFEVTITRQIITIESVRSKVIIEGEKKFGVISIRSFQEETYLEVHKALAAMMAQGPIDGFVLDLRNNPGGLLDQSLEIADRFLNRGDILYTVGEANTEEDVAKAHADVDDIVNVPLITLVDQGSASASEIVAGALKNNARSLLIGTQTFGKGSVQSLFSLRDGSSIKLTIAQYLTPGRVSIQAIGITPDIELTPSLVSDDNMDILNDNDSSGEKNLDEHLENEELIKKSKPAFSLRYLQEIKKDQAKESEYTSKIDEKNDYILNLALEILKKTKGSTKLDLLTQALPLLALESGKQDKILTEALAKKNIDWSHNNRKELKNITLNYESTFINKKSGERTASLKAGDEVEWQITVTNNLEHDITRLIGVVSAENPLLNYREFLFGKVPSKGNAIAKVTLKIPDETVSLSENVTLRFLSEQTDKIREINIPVTMSEKPRPIVAYKIDIKDNGSEGSSGNGNSRIEKGEKIALLVTLINKGTEDIANGFINLKNLEGTGLYLREGRSNIKNLKAGAETRAHLLFQVAKDFEKKEAKIELAFQDKTTKSGFTDTLIFPLNLSQAIQPQLGEIQILPTINIASSKSSLTHVSLVGEATDDQLVKDIQIYLNGRKVFYEANTQPTNKLEFTSSIKLEKGINVITLDARDNRNLSNKKTLVFMGVPKEIPPLKSSLLW